MVLANKSLLVRIEILASKSSDANQGRAPRETIGKTVSKIGVDFGPELGADVFGAGKKGPQNSGQNSGQNSSQFPLKFGTGLVPQNQKSTASSHPKVSSVLSRSGIVL